MDNKTAACITGFVVCAMFYANVSATRADMRDPGAGTFTLAGGSAKPAVFISPPWQTPPGTRAGTAARKPPLIGTSAQRHFAEYLQLHRSRIELARPRPPHRAAQP